MVNQLVSLGAILVTTALLSAQSTPHWVVPPSQAYTEGNNAFRPPWAQQGFDGRLQTIVDSSCFTGLPTPITMTAIKWRLNQGSSCGGGTYSGVTIDFSTAVVDYLTPGTIFANNHGADRATVFNGTVTLQPSGVAYPNLGTWFVDIPLTSPFVYDPANGDLVVDVVIPTGSGVGVGRGAQSDRESGPGTPASMLFHALPTATSASLVYTEWTNVLGFELGDTATYMTYGTGCYERAGSFYEQFDSRTYDLPGGVGITNSILLIPSANSGYQVTAGSNTWFPPVAPDLGMTNNSLAHFALPFTFAHAAGSTNDIQMCSNGYIWLDNTSTRADGSPTVGEFLAEAPRIAAAWQELDVEWNGSSTHIDVDPSGNAVYLTWLGVPEWGYAYSSNFNDIQVVLDASGTIEIRLQRGAITTGDLIVGYSLGNGSADPGPIDISASLPFSTSVISALALTSVTGRPVMGMPATLQTDNIPPSALLGATVFSFTPFPGISLTPMGMPGCFQYADLGWVAPLYFPTGSSETVQLGNLPTSPSWQGAHIYFQGVAFVPGVNPTGAITSNGVHFLLNLN